MKRKILFFFLLIAAAANAQVAGYMGKRFTVGYSNYFFPGLKGPGPSTASWNDEPSATFNNVNCLNFEYVAKERTVPVLSLQYMRTGIAYYRSYDREFYQGSEYCYPEQAAYKGNYSVPALLKCVNLGLGFKKFRRGSVAPVGGYQKFEFLLMFETVTYDNKHFVKRDDYNYDQDVVIPAMGTGEYKYRDFALVYTLGKQRVLFDKLVLDYGMRFAFAPPGFGTALFGIGFAGNSNMESVYRSQSHARLFREQMLNIHLGLGFLAF
jgi:hypothetical protein